MCGTTAGVIDSAVRRGRERHLPAPTTGRGFPDRVDLSIYRDAASQKKAFNALRASDPLSAAWSSGKGNCNNVSWNGFGIWRHQSDNKFGGQRYCYVDAGNTVIVWTHDRRNTPSHLDFIGIARLGGRGNGPELYNWWNFWHNHLGKCFTAPDCAARLP
jgi:hypothetical protein